MTTDIKPQLTEHHQDDDIAQYRDLCVSAVVGLILGVLSAAALVDPLMWFVPLAGIAVCGLALRKIARADSVLVGRKRALAGLVLSVIFGTAAVAEYTTYRALVRREGQQFAKEWFDLLAARQPQKAYQFTMPPGDRHPTDDTLWGFYRDGPRWHRQLLTYVEQPLVRTLVALGPNALVRYYATDGQTSDGERDILTQAFAVTLDDAGQRKTFFVGLTLHRHHLDDGQAAWKIFDMHTTFKPPGT
jgi:hypothetical protein